MDTFSILNYQGSKKSLLDFIHSNASNLINENSTILDIFSGTCCVGYSYKSAHPIYANDSEYYSYAISKALLSPGYENMNRVISNFTYRYCRNVLSQRSVFTERKKDEGIMLEKSDINGLVELYEDLPTVWNKQIEISSIHPCCELFTTYYSGSYFGISQAIDIDSIRYAIDGFIGTDVYFAMLASLFFAMKECVFSKDGHMAQPLSPTKNSTKLLSLRNKNVLEIFMEKLAEFFSDKYVNSTFDNKCFNMNFEELIKLPEINDNVSFIYADPPYTDMQYSRYYHLLNIVSQYNYPKPTENNGAFTKGLYVDGRFQSDLSKKSTCLSHLNALITFAHESKKNLAISFAYPEDANEQKTDRYVTDIDSLVHSCRTAFSSANVEVASLDYKHSNNRNSEQKKVVEYLILCKGS